MTGKSLGVDLGATWLRAALADEKGRVVRRWRIPAVRWTELPRALKNLRLGRLGRLTVGPTGVWKASDRGALARALKPLAGRVRVVSDVELAHEAAFGGGPGVLVIAGTGSIAFGKDPRGNTARAGGLGALLGDEGSGFWMGREALRHPKLKKYFPETLALRLAHDPKPIRAIAALAPKVLRLARTNAAARRIATDGAGHLAGLADRLALHLGFRGSVPICGYGSLFRDKLLRQAFLYQLGKRFKPSPMARTPDQWAAVSEF